jgi:hypothetical protein
VSVAAIKASYRTNLQKYGESITVRRYSGTGGSRTSTDYEARARVTEAQASELIGNLQQAVRKIIILAEDLEAEGFSFPMVANGNDKIVVRGKEMTVTAVDDNTRRVQGVLIALDVTVSG